MEKQVDNFKVCIGMRRKQFCTDGTLKEDQTQLH